MLPTPPVILSPCALATVPQNPHSTTGKPTSSGKNLIPYVYPCYQNNYPRTKIFKRFILPYLCPVMVLRLIHDWQEALASEFKQDYFQDLRSFVRREYSLYTCFPEPDKIFNAYNLCPPARAKVVIIGQDPYHEPGQAQGLCFSVADGTPRPPSLVNIFRELQSDTGCPPPLTGDLTSWAEQGVFLLNATLSVRIHQANSHAGHGWERFTDATIRYLNDRRQPIVFILWGSYAQRKAMFVDERRHLVLRSAHPSPLSAFHGFFGNHHFTLTNHFLRRQGVEPVRWASVCRSRLSQDTLFTDNDP